MKDFANSKRSSNPLEKPTMKDLSNLLKKMPQYQKELNAYALHMSLAEECVKLFNGKMKQIVETEQNLAMGCDANGKKEKQKLKEGFL